MPLFQDDMMTTSFSEQLPDFMTPEPDAGSVPGSQPALPGAVLRIPVSVQVVIGTARLAISQIAGLAPGTMLTLEEKLGTPVRMLVNGRDVARGTLVVIDESDGRLGLTITEVAGYPADS